MLKEVGEERFAECRLVARAAHRYQAIRSNHKIVSDPDFSKNRKTKRGFRFLIDHWCLINQLAAEENQVEAKSKFMGENGFGAFQDFVNGCKPFCTLLVAIETPPFPNVSNPLIDVCFEVRFNSDKVHSPETNAIPYTALALYPGQVRVHA